MRFSKASACGRALQQNTCRFLERVTMAAGIHLFPFRTEKLSPPAPMVLRGRLRGRVGRRPFFFALNWLNTGGRTRAQRGVGPGVRRAPAREAHRAARGTSPNT